MTTASPSACASAIAAGARVDDHDRLAVLPVVDQGLDRAAALGAVADDDDVLSHVLPPAGDPEHLAALRGEHLEGGPDQQHQERDAERGDDERVDQPGAASVNGAMSPYPVVLSVTVV